MSENLYVKLNDRSKQIFKTVVETYLETGSPSGSEKILKKADYFKYNQKKYYICETAGPGRRLFGEKSLKRIRYELLPLMIN